MDNNKYLLLMSMLNDSNKSVENQAMFLFTGDPSLSNYTKWILIISSKICDARTNTTKPNDTRVSIMCTNHSIHWPHVKDEQDSVDKQFNLDVLLSLCIVTFQNDSNDDHDDTYKCMQTNI
jgi:hypothetical protein